MKKTFWEKNAVINVKLRDDLYTLAQMMDKPFSRFFAISNQTGIWSNVDLNKVEILFTLVAAGQVRERLFKNIVNDTSVIFSTVPFERYFINAYVNYEGPYPFKGGALVDLGENGETGNTLAPVIKENLTLNNDRSIIEKHECTAVYGAQMISERLCRYFDTGINYDIEKGTIFPGL